jgi:hypothetical protein
MRRQLRGLRSPRNAERLPTALAPWSLAALRANRTLIDENRIDFFQVRCHD